MDPVKSTLRLLEEGDKHLKLSNNHDVIAILGLTGTGKTTTGLFLTTDDTQLFGIEQSKNYVIQDVDKKISATSSLVPEMMIEKPTGMAYYDFPGFEATSNSSTEIATTYFMKKVLNRSCKVKLVFVMDYDSVDRTDFLDLLAHATRFVKSVKKFQNSIGMIFTKVSSTETGTMEKIVEFLESLKNVEQLTGPEKELIEILLTRQNGGYERMSLFHRVDSSGALSTNTKMMEEKQLINRMIHETLNYTDSTENDFDYRIPQESQPELSMISEYIQDRVIEDFQEQLNAIKQRYSKLENEKIELETLSRRYRYATKRLSKMEKSSGVEELFQNVRLMEQSRRVRFIDPKYNITVVLEPVRKLLRETVNYFKDVGYWFEFLKNLEMKTSMKTLTYGEQRAAFNKTLDFVESENSQLTLANFSDLTELLGELSIQADESVNVDRIRNLEITPARASMLRQALEFTLRVGPKSICDDKRKQIIFAPYMKLSEALAVRKCSKRLEIIVGKKLLIDTDFDGIGKGYDLMIVAPIWEIVKESWIRLDGRDGRPHKNGKPGMPGLPGGNAGHFFGIAEKMINAGMLTVTANGGTGGPGEHGRTGADGEPGEDALPGVKYSGKEPKKVDWNWVRMMKPKVHQKHKGGSGTLGSKGGPGGAGGLGGYAGTIRMMVPSSANYRVSVADGKSGDPGEPGVGGFAGMDGSDVWKISSEYYRLSNPCKGMQRRETVGIGLNRRGQKKPRKKFIPNSDEFLGDYGKYVGEIEQDYYGITVRRALTHATTIHGDFQGNDLGRFVNFSYSVYLLDLIVRKCTKVRQPKFEGTVEGFGINLDAIVLTGRFEKLLKRLKRKEKVSDCKGFDPMKMVRELKGLKNSDRYVGIQRLLIQRLRDFGLEKEMDPEGFEREVDKLLMNKDVKKLN